MRFIPRTVMVGFVNALAILMFLAPLVAIVALTGAAAYGKLKVINIKSGDRTRLSTFSAGFFLLVLIMAFGDLAAPSWWSPSRSWW